MLIGRWSSDAFLRCIRHQVQEFTSGISARMIQHPSFFNVPHASTIAHHEDPRTPHNTITFAGLQNICRSPLSVARSPTFAIYPWNRPRSQELLLLADLTSGQRVWGERDRTPNLFIHFTAKAWFHCSLTITHHTDFSAVQQGNVFDVASQPRNITCKWNCWDTWGSTLLSKKCLQRNSIPCRTAPPH